MLLARLARLGLFYCVMVDDVRAQQEVHILYATPLLCALFSERCSAALSRGAYLDRCVIDYTSPQIWSDLDAKLRMMGAAAAAQDDSMRELLAIANCESGSSRAAA